MALQPSRTFWLAVVGLAGIGAIVAALSVAPGRHHNQDNSAGTEVEPVAHMAFLTNPPGVVDRTVRFESAAAFATGAFQASIQPSGPPARVVLNDLKPRDFPREGSWTTPVIESELPFTEFVPSWNAETPPDTGVVFEVRVRCGTVWSPWLFIGEWGRIANGPHLEHCDFGRVVEDNLQLKQPATAFQMRARFTSYNLDPRQLPMLRRLHMIYSGLPPESERAKWAQPALVVKGWERSLPVPYRAQGDAPPNLSYQLCSPTSTSMVLSYWGVDRPTLDNALAIYDPDHEMFGNWGRAVQFAGSLGLDAWLERFRNWDQVKARIAIGQPVIASIRYKVGEFPSSLMKSSKGHLIVIRGFTSAGDAICNDPGSRAKGNGVVYKASELGHAWFDHGGVGYVIVGKTPLTTQPATKPAVAVN